MSIKVTTKIWAQSRHTGTELLMLLALAEFADDSGRAFPSVAKLAARCRTTSRHATRLLAELCKSGELEVIRNAGPHGTNRFRIVIEDGASPDTVVTPDVDVTPDTHVTPDTDFTLTPTSGSPDVHVREPLTYKSPEPSLLNRQEPSLPAKASRKATKKLKADPPGYNEFYAAYPKKVDPQGTAKAFAKLNPDSELLVVMLAALERQKQSSQWIKSGGEFIPYPTTWLNKRRWEDSVSTAADAQDRPSWALSAGFPSRYEAENAGCRAHNAHLFANGLQKEVA